MIIGVPKERKQGECRVALRPENVVELVNEGHQVLIEQNAGLGSGFLDEEYSDCGAKILGSLAEVWSNCELLIKVKEPDPEEFSLFRPGLIVFSFFHAAVNAPLTNALLEKEVSGLSYDLLIDEKGDLPILEPMSAIAGRIAVHSGAYALQSGSGGRGVLLSGMSGVAPGRVVVLGAGIAGSNATEIAHGIGAEVRVLDIKPEKLMELEEQYPGIKTIVSTPESILKEISEADLVVGAVLVPGALAPKLITREMLSKMKPGAVIADISIDQGGCAETSRPTSIAEPTYIEEGIVHYCVPNIPGLTPRTSTEALTNVTLPWIKLLAKKGVEKAAEESAAIKSALMSYRGKLLNEPVATALGLPYSP